MKEKYAAFAILSILFFGMLANDILNALVWQLALMKFLEEDFFVNAISVRN